MAEINKENSAARLAALKKCAAADRSAARREALMKVAQAVAGGAKARPPAVNKIAAETLGADSGVLAKLISGKGLSDSLSRAINRANGARRYIQYTDPATLATIAPIVTGGVMLGSAVDPSKERSVTERVARGIGGVGMAGAGMYIGSNPKVRAAIRNAVFDFLGRTGAAASNK